MELIRVDFEFKILVRNESVKKAAIHGLKP